MSSKTEIGLGIKLKFFRSSRVETVAKWSSALKMLWFGGPVDCLRKLRLEL